MRVSIPIFYDTTVNVHGRRVDRAYQKTVDFDVPMAREEDAPVVLQGRGHEPSTYRLVGGSHFVDTHAVARSPDFDASVFAFLRKSGFKNLNEAGHVLHGRRANDSVVRRRGEPSPDSLVSSDLDRVIERLEKLIGSGVFVNDRLLSPCSEPCVLIKDDQAKLVHSEIHGWEKCYRPDERDLAVEERLHYGHGFDFEIVRSEHFSADFATARLFMAARSIASAAASIIAFLPLEAVAPFSLLRDHRRELPEVAQVIEAAETLITEIRESGEKLPYGFDRAEELFALTRDQWRSTMASKEVSALEQEQDDDAILSVGFA